MHIALSTKAVRYTYNFYKIYFRYFQTTFYNLFRPKALKFQLEWIIFVFFLLQLMVRIFTSVSSIMHKATNKFSLPQFYMVYVLLYVLYNINKHDVLQLTKNKV